MDAADLYREVCAYLTRNGWEREDPGSGWWFRRNSEGDPWDEQTMYDALREQLLADNIDVRMEPDPPPPAANYYLVTQIVRTPEGRLGILRAGIEWDTTPAVDDIPF